VIYLLRFYAGVCHTSRSAAGSIIDAHNFVVISISFDIFIQRDRIAKIGVASKRAEQDHGNELVLFMFPSLPERPEREIHTSLGSSLFRCHH